MSLLSLLSHLGTFLILAFSLAPSSGQTTDEKRVAINGDCPKVFDTPECVGRAAGVSCEPDFTSEERPIPYKCVCQYPKPISPNCLSLLYGDCLLGQTVTSCISPNMTCVLQAGTGERNDPRPFNKPVPSCICDQEVKTATICGPFIPRSNNKTYSPYFASATRWTSQVVIRIGMTSGSLIFGLLISFF